MTEIFESLEWPLFETLNAADGYIARMFTDASMMNIPRERFREFILERVIDMIDQIAEKREAQERVRPSRRKENKRHAM